MDMTDSCGAVWCFMILMWVGVAVKTRMPKRIPFRPNPSCSCDRHKGWRGSLLNKIDVALESIQHEVLRNSP
jgi:hypothetical protein